MDQPLTSGEGKMNAYFGPRPLGPDGWYHLVWIWRDTGDCATNHDISYARSKDLVHWETSAGKPLELPITLAKCDIVDPVPVKGGAINTVVTLGFDSRKRVIVSYIKYDEKGFTQAYNARLEDGRWKVYQASDWAYRWDFSGGGSIVSEVRLSGVSVAGEGKLAQSYAHSKYGNGRFILDETTLKLIEDVHASAAAPPKPAEDSTPKLEARQCGDAGSSGEPGVRYMLRWETFGVNRDRPRQGEIPPPSMLKLVRME